MADKTTTEQHRKRITDSVRLDWLADNTAQIAYQPNKVGPGWIQQETWFVRIGSYAAGSGTTLRCAIDAAINRESDKNEDTERVERDS